MYGVAPYFAAKCLAEAPISAAVSALGGACLYPLVGLNTAPGNYQGHTWCTATPCTVPSVHC